MNVAEQRVPLSQSLSEMLCLRHAISIAEGDKYAEASRDHARTGGQKIMKKRGARPPQTQNEIQVRVQSEVLGGVAARNCI